ncbi:hypothetical protein AB0A91_16240 [Streptomyces sp. NPDC042207]|uniref:hypothetical protein n=1 Tax=Streptomyces sp. NPDC042207 TaxID=3154331 RepID=UPI0033C596D5
MGYDMTIVQERDQAERDAIAAAQKHVNSLTSPYSLPEGEERDAAEKTWKDAWKAYDAADRSYFRLNIWAMSCCCDVMASLGMLTPEEAPSFPRLEEFGITDYPEDPADYDGEERAKAEAELTDGGRQYLAAVKAALAFEPVPVRGIPAGKFSSNDGWLVTPAQCEAALAAWRAQPDAVRARVEGEIEWWARWVAYLTYAQGRGGFRVY